MTEWCLFKSLNTCSTAPDMPFTLLSPSSSVFFVFQTSPFCSVCSLKLLNLTRALVAFVTLHLWPSICILPALPRSRNWSNVLWAFIIYTTWPIFRGLEGGSSISSPSPPTSLHQMPLAKSLPVVFDLVLTPQVLSSLEGLLDDLSLHLFYMKPEHIKKYQNFLAFKF